jgi:sRNA-binding regulator protein Hfq
MPALNRLKYLTLAFLLIFVPLARASQAQPQSVTVDQTAKVKSEVAKRVDNKKTRVKIKLRNGEELKGRIDQAADNTFTITQDKTGKKIEPVYSEVAEVKGRGMSTLTKIGIVVGVAVAVVAVAVVVALKNFDPFSNGGIVPR